jgi:hypothetical protein
LPLDKRLQHHQKKKGKSNITVNDLVQRFDLQVGAGAKGLERRVEDG